MPEPHDAQRRDDRVDAGPASARPDPRLLEEVLQHTSMLLSNDSSHTAADIECLQAVAERHGDEDLDTVLPRLVFAMLQRIFGDTAGAGWEPMTNAIAESLQEDPTARLRVENLWQRLCERRG